MSDFSAHWKAAIVQNHADKFALSAMLRCLRKVGAKWRRYPPQMLPPPVEQATETSSAGMTAAAVAAAARDTNVFALLDEDDDESEDGDEGKDDDDDEDAEALAVAFAALSTNPHAATSSSTQVRYLQVEVECCLSEVVRFEAKELEKKDAWRDMADTMKTAFDLLNDSFTRMDGGYDAWVALQLDANEGGRGGEQQMPDGHNKRLLDEALAGMLLARDSIELDHLQCTRKLLRYLAEVDERLNPQLAQRDQAKEKMGEEAWRNNKRPKQNFAQARRELEIKRRELAEALRVLEDLRLYGNDDGGASTTAAAAAAAAAGARVEAAAGAAAAAGGGGESRTQSRHAFAASSSSARFTFNYEHDIEFKSGQRGKLVILYTSEVEKANEWCEKNVTRRSLHHVGADLVKRPNGELILISTVDKCLVYAGGGGDGGALESLLFDQDGPTLSCVGVTADFSRLCAQRGAYSNAARVVDVRERILSVRSRVQVIDEVLASGGGGTGLCDLAEKMLLVVGWKREKAKSMGGAGGGRGGGGGGSNGDTDRDFVVYSALDAWSSSALYDFYNNLKKKQGL